MDLSAQMMQQAQINSVYKTTLIIHANASVCTKPRHKSITHMHAVAFHFEKACVLRSLETLVALGCRVGGQEKMTALQIIHLYKVSHTYHHNPNPRLTGPPGESHGKRKEELGSVT